jgi:Ca2+-binding EF-hand superfamily protein
MTSLALFATLFLASPGEPPPAAAFEALGDAAVQDLVILGEDRPILLRLRIMIGDRAFRAQGADDPFRLQVDGDAELRRTDVLFDHIDRDKDRQLSRSELAAIVGSLHRLDRDADELIDADEVSLVAPPAASPMPGRTMRDATVSPVHTLAPEDSPVRLARMLIKFYDKESGGRRDGKLSPDEFAISPDAFTAADKSGDGTLSSEEIRTYLTSASRDAILDIQLSAEPNGTPLLRVTGDSGISAHPLADGLVEIDVGMIRLDIHVDDGSMATTTAHNAFHERFASSDVNNDGYVDKDELTQDNGLQSPLSPIFATVDADKDGKLYPKELDEYVDREAKAAGGRLTLTASDEGRALFGMLDINRDRRLGAREVLETFTRVSACDRDGDGKVTPEEVPHHIQLTLSRGDLSALLAPPADGTTVQVAAAQPRAVLPVSRPTAGPDWFRKMDRNGDGDVSRREFLGTHPQFDRLDLDHDGMLSPAEADAATAAAK